MLLPRSMLVGLILIGAPGIACEAPTPPPPPPLSPNKAPTPDAPALGPGPARRQKTDVPAYRPPTQESNGKTWLNATFEDGKYDGLIAETGANASVSIVGPDEGVQPFSGTKMVKLFHSMGAPKGASYAQLRFRLIRNPAHTPEGIYIRWRMYITPETMRNANDITFGKDAQIKTHLYRVPDQDPKKFTPTAYHGLVLGVGTTFGGNFAAGKDHLNIWILEGNNGIDNRGPWKKHPRYKGGSWLTIQEWYQTDDGVNTQYKLWFNDRLARAERFNNADGSMNKLIGGAADTPYDVRLGMPYLVNRSPGSYTIYLDDVTIRNTYIEDPPPP